MPPSDAGGGPDHGPGVPVPPPLLVAGTILVAWLLRRLLPLPVMAPQPVPGDILFGLALALIVWAGATMLRAGTDPRPDRPDAALVTTGPFRFSRNPFYLGFVLIAAGFALRWGDLWGWLAVAALLRMLDRLAIAREEAYLARRFGAAYRQYRAKVRRWI